MIPPPDVGGDVSTVGEDVAAMSGVQSAQASLQHAWTDLDAAVGSLEESNGDNVMASATLVGLLHHVAIAQSRLADFTPPADSLPASLR